MFTMREGDAIMPLWDTIILELPEEAKPAGLVLPQGSEEKLQTGTLELKVLWVGPDCLNVKEGDRLVFNPGAVFPMGIDGKQYFFTTERQTHIAVAPLRKMLRDKSRGAV